jgi:Asp/Glu/hydantoin racemase
MKTVAAVYTAEALVKPLTEVFAAELPQVRLINIVDGGLIQDIIRDGRVTTGTARRLMHCFMAAADSGADVIFNTCSSVGDVVPHARWFVPREIIKIDDPMAEQAVRRGKRIGVLATLPTTLDPTVRLVKDKAADAGRSVEIMEGLAEGAFQALTSGDPEKHDDLLRATAARVASEVDLLVLAQGSMARMEQELASLTGKPVLSSPRSGVAAVKAYLLVP